MRDAVDDFRDLRGLAGRSHIDFAQFSSSLGESLHRNDNRILQTGAHQVVSTDADTGGDGDESKTHSTASNAEVAMESNQTGNGTNQDLESALSAVSADDDSITAPSRNEGGDSTSPSTKEQSAVGVGTSLARAYLKEAATTAAEGVSKVVDAATAAASASFAAAAAAERKAAKREKKQKKKKKKKKKREKKRKEEESKAASERTATTWDSDLK